MKKLILITAIFLVTMLSFAQAPEKMSYQAIIRNASGQFLQNQNVGVKVSVLQGSASGTVAYSERLTGTTNANGLLSLEIGSGAIISGIFNTIDWSSGNYYLKTETDPTGGTNYTLAGTSQLLSVPYALYAKTSGNSSAASNWGTSGTNIYNTNTGKVGIGTNAPATKLSVKANGAGVSQVSQDDTVNMGFYTDTNGAYVQTNSDHDLKFATANAPAQMTLQKTTGNLGIGTTAPTEKLEINGKTKTTNLQVTNGAGTGKILTSDAAGNASWKDQNNYLFSVYNNSSEQVLVNGAPTADVKLNDIFTNESGVYNITTKTFTAPKDGIYHFDVDLGINASNGTTNPGVVQIEISGTGSLPSGTTYNNYPFHTYQMPIQFLKEYGVNGINYSATLKIYAGFTYKLRITSPAGTHQIEVYRATFTGYLMKSL